MTNQLTMNNDKWFPEIKNWTLDIDLKFVICHSPLTSEDLWKLTQRTMHMYSFALDKDIKLLKELLKKKKIQKAALFAIK